MLANLLIFLMLAAPPSTTDDITPRKRNPLAPSLPLLTEEEEKKLDEIVDRFIQADTGKTSGPTAKQAMDEFKDLGPEATFALIRGINKAAKINHSCPALTIGRKLAGILKSSDDRELLLYAKENIGLGIKQSQHMNTLTDLKSSCGKRIAALKNAPVTEIRGAKP